MPYVCHSSAEPISAIFRQRVCRYLLCYTQFSWLRQLGSPTPTVHGGTVNQSLTVCSVIPMFPYDPDPQQGVVMMYNQM